MIDTQRVRLAREIPTDLESGLAQHDYHYRNWRWADNYTTVYYQFRRLRDEHTRSLWQTGTPYEWTLDEAWDMLRTLDAQRPHAQLELEL